MESWFRRILLTAVVLPSLVMVVPVQAAQDERSVLVIEPQIDRRDVQEPEIDAGDFELALFVGSLSIEDFGVSLSQSVNLSFQVTPWGFIEGSYGQSTAELSSYERLSGAARFMDDNDRLLSYYFMALGVNLMPGEAFWGRRAYNTSLYVVGGLGSVNFAGDDRSSVMYGVGYRLLLNDWLGVHLNVRGYLFDMDLLGEQKTMHSVGNQLGVSIFF